MAEYRPLAPTPPPTLAQLMEVFRRSIPEEYWTGLDGHDSISTFRAMAGQWAVLAEKLTESIEARYYQNSALAIDYPATEGRYARGQVTLVRISSWEEEIVLDPGDLVIEIVGRRYYNEEPIVWNPGDHGERIATFVCEVPAFIGNLDFLAEQDGTIDLEHIAIVDRSRSRAGTAGYVIDETDPMVLTDTGIDDLFAPEDVGLYVDILQSSSLGNVGPYRKVLGWSWPESEFPIGSGRFPRHVSLDTSPRSNALEIFQDDTATETFVTEELTEEGTDSVVTALVEPINATINFGNPIISSGVVLNIETPGEGSWTYIWEFYDGAAWQPLEGVVDPSNGLRPRLAGEYTITWTPPNDAGTYVSTSGLEGYYVRMRIVAPGILVTDPVLSRAVIKAWQPLNDADATSWSLLGPLDLGVSIVECEAFSGGRDDDLYILGAERGLYRQANEDPETFRARITKLLDVVSPNAINRIINRALAPYGLKGYAIDVSNGLTGLFLDLDAMDYYEAGDVFPEDPWKLLLSEEETRWFFLVVLPYLVLGEFGMFLDEGPPYFNEPSGTWLGPAADFGFMDGYAIIANAVYAAIWDAIDKARAGGIAFDLTRDQSLNQLQC